MKVWITKYALTKGIFTAEADVSSEYPNMATLHKSAAMDHYHGNDWHRDEASAKARAEVMRNTAVKALDKKRAKLLQLTF